MSENKASVFVGFYDHRSDYIDCMELLGYADGQGVLQSIRDSFGSDVAAFLQQTEFQV